MHHETVFYWISGLVLGVAAALFHGSAFVLYAIRARLGHSSPKSASWALWAFLATVNALTFRTMSGDVATLQFFTGSVACVAVFVYMWAIGKLKWPEPNELLMFAFGLVAIYVWWRYRNAGAANLIIFAALVISFKPTFDGLRTDPYAETSGPWNLWTIAFLITAANVVLRSQGGPRELALQLVMPIGGAVLHGAVAFLSRRERRLRLGFGMATRQWS